MVAAMAIGAAAVATPVSASSFRRTILSPTSLAPSSHPPFKHIHEHYSCNIVLFKRNLSCRSTDTSTKISFPTCNNRYSTLFCLLTFAICWEFHRLHDSCLFLMCFVCQDDKVDRTCREFQGIDWIGVMLSNYQISFRNKGDFSCIK